MSGVTDDLGLFACALRCSRSFRGWTNKEVGERAEMDQNEIALIQRGERVPTLLSMKCLSLALTHDRATVRKWRIVM